MSVPLSRVRNFCIIAHIDHGKSTLADRLLLLTDTISEREFREQMLDDMELERERGITIKSRPVTMQYRAADGELYELNLIDTPGHVDFTYEVSRSMAACEGAILVVDAAQGVEAQTVANVYLAMDRDLTIVPVLNKIDLPSADVEGVNHQIEDVLAIEVADDLRVSAKTGEGTEAVLEAIVRRVPPPRTASPAECRGGVPPRALVFDSAFDAYRGVVIHVRVFDGELRPGDSVRLMGSGTETQLKEVGIFSPSPHPVEKLKPGNVGYLVGTIKDPGDVRVGDTVTSTRLPASAALPGFQDVHPMVFCGLYPVDTAEYEKLRLSLDKLSLNDASFTYHAETSVALGFGFRCGFLGLLHMEVVQERLRREFDLELIGTHPAVVYRIFPKSGETIEIDNPTNLPDQTEIDRIEEPVIKAFIICLNEHIGDIMRLVMDRRGEVTTTDSIDTSRVMLTCSLPLNEILTDFHDLLKSISRGYASMDYDHAGYAAGDIVRMDILLNAEPVDAFSTLVHREKAVARGRQICKALKDAIPPHMFPVPIQAALNRTIIARETIRAYRKDVTAKLYGGDITRKRKVLEKQKAGKKRMKQFGKVSVPQKAFISVLRTGQGS